MGAYLSRLIKRLADLSGIYQSNQSSRILSTLFAKLSLQVKDQA